MIAAMATYNSTHGVLDVAIDRLEEQLENAREMPPWAITLVVMMSVIIACCLLQALALIVFGPVVFAYTKLRGGANQHLLPAEGEADNSGEVEIVPSGDDCDVSPKVTSKRHGKTKATFKSKSGTPVRQHHAINGASSSSSRGGDEFYDMEL